MYLKDDRAFSLIAIKNSVQESGVPSNSRHVSCVTSPSFPGALGYTERKAPSICAGAALPPLSPHYKVHPGQIAQNSTDDERVRGSAGRTEQQLLRAGQVPVPFTLASARIAQLASCRLPEEAKYETSGFGPPRRRSIFASRHHLLSAGRDSVWPLCRIKTRSAVACTIDGICEVSRVVAPSPEVGEATTE